MPTRVHADKKKHNLEKKNKIIFITDRQNTHIQWDTNLMERKISKKVIHFKTQNFHRNLTV